MIISIKKNFPFIHFGRNDIERGNSVSMKREYGNSKNTIIITGRNNIIESRGKVRNTKIRMIGDKNSVLFENDCNIIGASLVIIGNNCIIKIGAGSTCGQGCWMVVMGEMKSIIIGLDVMMADNVDLWASDSHPIYDTSIKEEIINPSGNIYIDNHVWIGKKSVVLKNVTIGENSIVGMASVVTKDIPSGCVAVGNPAHIVKRGVNWDRKHIKV